MFGCLNKWLMFAATHFVHTELLMTRMRAISSRLIVVVMPVFFDAWQS